MKLTFAILASLLVIIGLGWFFTANDLAMSAFFSPKMEQVRYNTFKQSQAYNDSAANDLRKDQIEYQNATPEGKASIRSVILAQYASYNENMLPPDAYAFLEQLRNEQH